MTAWEARSAPALKRTGIRRKRQLGEVWKLDCGATWPIDYVPEEKTKGYPTYFRKMVQDLAHALGWKTYHAHFPFFDEPGLPDLYLIPTPPNGRHPLWRELKVRRKSDARPGPTSPKQDEFIYGVVAAGSDAKVWLFPDDWRSGLIEQELRG